jgi:response regulator RpfG family c-di-GMP phosphodiesterase
MDIPVLVITGMDQDDEEVAAVQRMVNVQEILFKPLDLSVLRKTDLSRRGRSDTIGCLPANLGS